MSETGIDALAVIWLAGGAFVWSVVYLWRRADSRPVAVVEANVALIAWNVMALTFVKVMA